MRIVVGVDGSPGAQRALEWAVAEGRARGAGVTAVLAYGYYGRPFEVQTRTAGNEPEDLDSAARAVLHKAVTDLAMTATASAPPGEIRELVSDDEPVDALLGEVGPADVLAVGARGLGPVRRLLLGSVSLHCTRHATAPTVIVRDRREEAAGTPERRPVVVGIDGSPESVTALRWSAEHARCHRLPLHVIHAWAASETEAIRVDELFHVAERRDRDRRAIETLLDRTIDAGQRADVTLRLLDGNPVGVLLEAAEDASLLVVGSRGQGGISRLLLGSTSAACLQHAPCNVAVVPQTRDDRP
jgi:nucleotide-binding universal stress UspA family protein